MEIFYGILAAITLSVIIMFFQTRKKNQQSWSGTVVKIKEKQADYNVDPDYESTNDYKDYVNIYYQTDSGKKGKIKLEKNQFNSMYPNLKTGSRLIKQTGKNYPETTSNAD